MHSNILMYLTALSAVSIHNLMNNIHEATGGLEPIVMKTSDSNWTFHDKSLIKTFPLCNGLRQSPINIETARVRENRNLRLGLTAYDKPISGILVNEFPTAQLVPFSFRWPKPNALITSSLARSIEAELESHYTLNQVQFFWSQGDSNYSSAIHQIDKEDAQLEIHFIHFNTAYRDLDEALNKPDGLLIFAVLVAPSTHESYIFDQLLAGLKNITNHGDQIMIDEDSSWRTLLPQDTSRFFRYHGSTIMPPCHESVQWIVFEEKLKLGSKQLKKFRRHRFVGKDLRTDQLIDWSAQRRPPQPMNNRIVERSFSLRAEKRDDNRSL